MFADELGLAIRVDRAGRMLLVDRQPLRLPVDRRAATEHDRANTLGLHRLEQGEQAADVVGMIGQWVGDRFRHGLERGEMDNRVDTFVDKDRPNRRYVANIATDDRESDAGKLGKRIGNPGRAVAEIVEQHWLMARRQQCERRVRADVAAAASQQDAH